MKEKELLKTLEQAIIDFKQEPNNTTKELAFRYLILAKIYLEDYLKGADTNGRNNN